MQHLKLLVWGFWGLFLLSGASIISSEEKYHSPDTIIGDLYQADFICPHYFGAYPDPEDCSAFYVCIVGVAHRRKCGFLQRFEKLTKRCLPAFLVICDNNKDTTTTTSPKIITSQRTTRAKIESTTGKTTTTTKTTSTTKTIVEDIKTTTYRPTGPPDHTCNEDDVDCIITETGDVEDWFICPQDVGSYVHPSSDKLFIFCMNWIPSVKKCGLNLIFSEEKSTCIEEIYVW